MEDVETEREIRSQRPYHWDTPTLYRGLHTFSAAGGAMWVREYLDYEAI